METPNLDIGGVNSSPKATTSVNDGKKESKHSSSKNGRKHTSSNLEAPRKQQGSTHNDTRTGKEDQKGDLKHEIRALDHDDGEEGGSGGEEGGHISMTFPQKLMAVLNNEDHVGIISWLPHGKGFLILKRKLFEKAVMPKFFSRHGKYTSFTRKLNRWGFVRVTRGPEMGAYYNKLFQRDDPTLCLQMTCHRPNELGLDGGFAVPPMPAGRNHQLYIPQTALQNHHQLLQGQNLQQRQQQQQQQQQQLQSVGLSSLETLHQQPNIFELQQLRLVMMSHHREHMMRRESLGGTLSPRNLPSLQMQHQLQVNGLVPPELYQYRMGMDSGIEVGGRSIMVPLVPQGSLQLMSRDYQTMSDRDGKLRQYKGKPLSQADFMGL